MSATGGRTAGRYRGRRGGGRPDPTAIVEMIAQAVLRAAGMLAGADQAVAGDGSDTPGTAGAGAVRGTGRRCAYVASSAVIGAAIAWSEGVERLAVEDRIGVLLIDIVGLIDDRRTVPLGPVDPAGADIGDADIDVLDKGHNGNLHVAGMSGGVLQDGEQLTGSVLQGAHLAAGGIALGHGAGIVQHQRHPQFGLAPNHVGGGDDWYA